MTDAKKIIVIGGVAGGASFAARARRSSLISMTRSMSDVFPNAPRLAPAVRPV